jgi:hypothetical protein
VLQDDLEITRICCVSASLWVLENGESNKSCQAHALFRSFGVKEDVRLHMVKENLRYLGWLSLKASLTLGRVDVIGIFQFLLCGRFRFWNTSPSCSICNFWRFSISLEKSVCTSLQVCVCREWRPSSFLVIAKSSHLAHIFVHFFFSFLGSEVATQ